MNRMTEEGRKQLEELIAQVMKDGQARGIAVGIVDSDGQIQYENYFGTGMKKINYRLRVIRFSEWRLLQNLLRHWLLCRCRKTDFCR